jgi:hypothetical protein
MGTPQYTPAMRRIMKMIPFQKLLDDLSDKELDPKRGNYQHSYGFASGHSYQARTDANVLKHFGAAVPSIRVGTKDNLPLLLALTDLAKEIRMKVVTQEYLSANPDVVHELRFVESEIGTGVVHALVTVCFVRLDNGTSKVLEHTDDQNGTKVTEVMIAAMTLLDKKGMYVLKCFDCFPTCFD